jgi:MinD-like ATPase involved in chromosome partitioning or flagellar assembly
MVAFCSGKGSPGVSTLASVVGAVWPRDRQIVIAECDPSGNDLAARFGLSPRLGMTSLVLAHRRTSFGESMSTLDAHVQALPGGLEVLVGPVTPDASSSLDRELGAVVPTIFPEGSDILVDCGRILSGAGGQRGLLKVADHVVVVTRPDAAALAHAQWTLDLVRNLATTGTCSVAVVGPSPFRVAEIEHALQVRVLGPVPFDGKSAAMACGSPGKTHRFTKSGLVASARNLVDRILSPLEANREVPSTIDLIIGEGTHGASDEPASTHYDFEWATPRRRRAEPG